MAVGKRLLELLRDKQGFVCVLRALNGRADFCPWNLGFVLVDPVWSWKSVVHDCRPAAAAAESHSEIPGRSGTLSFLSFFVGESQAELKQRSSVGLTPPEYMREHGDRGRGMEEERHGVSC